MNIWSYEEDRQINSRLCLSTISAKIKCKGAVGANKDSQYNPRGHREDYLEEGKGCAEAQFVKDLDEIVEKIKKGARNPQATMATLK